MTEIARNPSSDGIYLSFRVERKAFLKKSTSAVMLAILYHKTCT
jgi:hypothetical protein